MKQKKLIAILLSMLLLTGCGSKAPVQETTEPTVTENTRETEAVTLPSEVVEPTQTENEKRYQHPLTGEALSAPYAGERPYAVMVNNYHTALPQCGIGQADVIYEILAEGGITRMMAIYTSLKDETPLGSIRSLRPYYLSVARSYDAIVVHAGGSAQADADVQQAQWDHIDGIRDSGDHYYRVEDRIENAGYEHSLFIDAGKMKDYAKEEGFRLTWENAGPYFNFSDQPMTDGESAKEVTVHFSQKSTSFSYNEGEGRYYAEEYDAPWVDGNTDKQQAFENVLVLRAEIRTVDNEGHLEVTLVGSGEGQLIRDGKCVPITWSRGAEDAPFLYTLADGSAAPFAPGRTYVAVIHTDSNLELQ